jgi:hypothetical protein
MGPQARDCGKIRRARPHGLGEPVALYYGKYDLFQPEIIV